MKRKPPATAVKCGACDGTGKVPVLGARVRPKDPGRCAKCGGKGRITPKP
jgi:DnaJ-class molecular chaperone